jgi:hypothetical protein
MPPFPKGSKEMKEFMAKIRMKKGDPRIKNTGGKKTKPKPEAPKVDVPILGEQSVAIPEFFAVKAKKGYRLVNPLTKTRNLSSRKGEPSIKLIRKPVEDMIIMSHQSEPVPLTAFSKKDRETIHTHFKVVQEHKGKDPENIPDSKPFKNKERGRPETLPKNIKINKERGYKPKPKKKPKDEEEEEEETKEETEQEEEKEAEEVPKRGRPAKFQTEEARLEAVRKAKREWAAKDREKKGMKKRVKGGAISAKDLKALHQSAYKKDKDKQIGDWEIDESISKPTAVVYVNQKTKQPIVIHRGTEGTLKDWSNNLAYVAGLSKKTQRYKDSEAVQKQAEEKYGDTLTSAHSQGAIYSKLAKNKKGIIDINPASMGEVATEGTTIRAKNDPVSLLAGLTNVFRKSDKNITTSAKVNPLEAHSLNILDELGDKELGAGLKGRGKKFTHRQLTDIILHKNKVIEDLEKNAYGTGLVKSSKKVLGHLVEHITDMKEPVDKRDFEQAKMIIDDLKDLKENKKISTKVIMPKKMEEMVEKMAGCGIHHHHHYHMGGMGIEDMMRDAGKDMKGSGWEDMMRDAGKYIQPITDAAIDRATKEIRGSGFKKGSKEAKEHMARIRAMRKGSKKKEESDSDSDSDNEERPAPTVTKMKRRGRFVKGSKEAKEYMASIRRKK